MSPAPVHIERIERAILIVRGQKVMLDASHSLRVTLLRYSNPVSKRRLVG